MAARSPRRTFATPFVITLAAIPGCYRDSKPEPPPYNPPPPQPQPQPTPEPTPAPSANREWRITKDKGNCLAFAAASCPTPEPGKPQPTCNPPPPTKYTCPPNMADGATLIVTQLQGQGDCFVMPEPPKCPPNAACNPPPPRKVTCP